MRYKHLIQALTGTKQIVCESIEMNEAVGAISIIAHPDKKSQCRCGICQKKCPRYDYNGPKISNHPCTKHREHGIL